MRSLLSADVIVSGGFAVGLTVFRAAIVRNRKCLLAYLQHRSEKIRSLRWRIGTQLAPKFRDRMCPDEHKFFSQYDNLVTEYLNAVGTLSCCQLKERASLSSLTR